MAAGVNAAIALRLLGAAPGIPPQELRRFGGVAWTGFALNAVSGLMLLIAYPTKALTNPVFYLKMSLIAIGLGCICGGLGVYEILCRSPLGSRPRLFGAVWFAVLTAAAYALTHIFSARGAFIHVGAIIGTITLINRDHQFAPSMRAASMTSDGTAVRPARTVIAPKGTARHVLTRITANIAATAVPSH